MFTWTDCDGNQFVVSVSVASCDQELVALALHDGAIVNVSAKGEFNFASSSVERALRTAFTGDVLIHPCGKTFTVGN